MPKKYGVALLALLLPVLGACAHGSAGLDAQATEPPRADTSADRVAMGRLVLTSDPARAAGLFSAALASSPHDAVAMGDLGIALDLQGRHAEAQAAYRRALAVRPDLRAARVNLALSLALDGNADRALDTIAPVGADATAGTVERADIAAVHALVGR